jgi:DNA-binding CsgD family transcriptional regulator
MTRPVPAGCPLSPRQFEIMVLSCEGLNCAQIAQRLFFDRHTIADDMRRICVVLGAPNSIAAVARFVGCGWLEDVRRDYSNERAAA